MRASALRRLAARGYVGDLVFMLMYPYVFAAGPNKQDYFLVLSAVRKFRHFARFSFGAEVRMPKGHNIRFRIQM